MSSTAHKTAAEYVEHFDSEEVLEAKITKLAAWLKASKHAIAFTGAGISTSTGVPDFRSGMNTVLKTGAGAWTIRAEEEKQGKRVQRTGTHRVSTLQAIPSPAHMSLVALQKAGLLKFLVSQNTDGLHRRSGFPTEALAELHGNSNLETCSNKKCKKEYLRDYGTRNNGHVHQHETGRLCAACGSMLLDTIINFGENLPEKAINDGFAEGEAADLCLSLGSSLRVTPAATIPEIVGKKKDARLVIVNLQSTPLDDLASMRINATIDTVFERLMPKLNIPIPSFVLRRQVQITQFTKPPDINTSKTRSMINIQGIDVDKTPVSLFRSVKVAGVERKSEPLTMVIPPTASSSTKISSSAEGSSSSVGPSTIEILLEPMGNYREPPVSIQVPLKPNSVHIYSLQYDPVHTGTWIHIDLIDARSGEAASKELSLALVKPLSFSRAYDEDDEDGVVIGTNVRIGQLKIK